MKEREVLAQRYLRRVGAGGHAANLAATHFGRRSRMASCGFGGIRYLATVRCTTLAQRSRTHL